MRHIPRCSKSGMTTWKCHVVAALGDVFAFFGTGRLAKELYDDAGLDDAEEVR